MTTPVTVVANIETNGLDQVRAAVADIQKTVNLLNGSFKNYETNLKRTLGELEKVSRAGAPGQTIRDLQLTAGGSSIAGRVRSAMAKGQIADMKQTEQVVVAQFVNDYRSMLKGMTKSTQAALVKEYARSRQEIANATGSLSAQIEAQQARVAMAAQMNGTRSLNRVRLQSQASQAGMDNIGTLRQEKAALDGLLATEQKISAANAQQLRDTNALVRAEEQLKRATDARFAVIRDAQKQMTISQRMGQQDLRAVTASATGDRLGVVSANAKKEALRLEQMILSGIKEESIEYQKQMGIIRGLALEKAKIQQEGAKSLAQTREQTALERSRRFAGGDSTMRETSVNNMIGARQAAGSLEGRASLLGLQGNLMLNYALLGSVTTAIMGMTTAVVDLDTEMRQLQAISGATNKEYADLRETIIETSTGTKFSAVELAEGATMLAQVGLSAAQIKSTLPAISDFAMAVGTDMKNAVDITTTSLTVFNMSTDRTQYVLNVMAESLNRSKLSMDQLQLGFQYAANIVADAGGTFEELTAVLAGMSQAGIRAGSMLGTGLRQIMISLASPTEELSALLTKVGLTMYDVDVRSQGLVGVLENIRNSGMTASDAMSVFETRTAAALIAATNQVDFIKQIQEGYAFTTAAEQAAAVQKQALANSTAMLTNSFLAFVNNAAEPVVTVLIKMVTGLKNVMEVAAPLAPLFNLIGTALLLMTGAGAIAGIISLVGTFVRMSGVVNAVTTSIAAARSAMLALSAASVVSAAGTTGLTAAMIALRTALFSLLLNPVVLGLAAVTAVIGGLILMSDKGADSTSKLRGELDALQAKTNEAKAEFQRYDEILSQIDGALARARARTAEMQEGSSALHIEVLQGAMQFNQYGANIDATTNKLEPLIAGLGRARIAVLQLRAAQAQQAMEESARSNAKATGSFNSDVNRFRGTMGGGSNAAIMALGRELQGRGLPQAQIDRVLHAANVIANQGNANTAADIGNVTAASSTIVSILGANGVSLGGRGRAALRAGRNVRDSSMVAGASRTSFDMDTMTATAAGLVLTPQMQSISRAVTPEVNASALRSQVSQIQMRGRRGEISPAEVTRQINALVQSAGSSYRNTNNAFDYQNSLAGTITDPGRRMAFDQIMSPAATALGEVKNALTDTVRSLDESFTKLEPNLSSALQNGASLDAVRSLAQRAGITDLDGVTNSDQARQVLANRRARIENNLTVGEVTGYVNPADQIRFESGSLAAGARINKQAGSRAASEQSAAEKEAKDAKRASDSAASSFQRLANAQTTRMEQLFKGITDQTSIEQAEAQIDRAQEAFTSADEFMRNYFEEKISGLEEYKTAMGSGLSAEELDDVNSEIDNFKAQADLSVENMKQEFNDKLVLALQKVPELGKPFTTLLDLVDKTLKSLDVELNERMAEINQITANREAVASGLGVSVRQGNVSSAEATAYDNRYQKALDARDGQASRDRLDILEGRRAAIGNALSNDVKIGDQTLNLENIDEAVSKQRSLVNTLKLGTEEYGLQSARLTDMEAVQNRIYEFRNQELEVNQAISAELERQNILETAKNGTIQQRLGLVVNDWMDTNGYGQDVFTSMLDGVPEILTSTQGAFSTFFNDILSGTASVKDAFRTMATSILQSMMQVVSNEIAKSFMRMILNLGMSFLGGGPSFDASTATTSGFSNTSFNGGGWFGGMREGGPIRAANGYGVRGRDSVPILGMPGEYLLRKSAVDSIGIDNLDAINASGNRAVSGQDKVKPVMMQPAPQERPLNVYVVSPDKQPPMSRDDIIIAVQEDMVNKGPVYKTVRAAQQGAI